MVLNSNYFFGMGEDATIKDEVEKVEKTTPNLVNEQIEQRKSIFPQVSSEGKTLL
jgi:hypothetical protein